MQTFDYTKAKTENVTIKKDPIFGEEVNKSFCDSKEIITNNCRDIPTNFIQCLKKKKFHCQTFIFRAVLLKN